MHTSVSGSLGPSLAVLRFKASDKAAPLVQFTGSVVASRQIARDLECFGVVASQLLTESGACLDEQWDRIFRAAEIEQRRSEAGLQRGHGERAAARVPLQLLPALTRRWASTAPSGSAPSFTS